MYLKTDNTVEGAEVADGSIGHGKVVLRHSSDVTFVTWQWRPWGREERVQVIKLPICVNRYIQRREGMSVYLQSWLCGLCERSHKWQSRRVRFCPCCQHLPAYLRRTALPCTSRTARWSSSSASEHKHIHEIYYIALDIPKLHYTGCVKKKKIGSISLHCFQLFCT